MAQSFIEKYKSAHRHPMNKLTHAIGIPMIIISIGWVYFDWKIALTLFVVGWIFQFIGHAFEGNRPAFFSNPIYLLVGPLWLIKRVGGLLRGRAR
ncbi:MAG: DUF962 domain-containing protein [Acidobacteriota bacterium]